jgi:RNA polymerase sigma-70 factor, ECF subfamily
VAELEGNPIPLQDGAWAGLKEASVTTETVVPEPGLGEHGSEADPEDEGGEIAIHRTAGRLEAESQKQALVENALSFLEQGGHENQCAAFEILWHIYSGELYRYANHILPRDSFLKAADVVAEAFARAWKARDRFSGSEVGGWLVKITKNIVRDNVKSSAYKLEIRVGDVRELARADLPAEVSAESLALRGLPNAKLVVVVRMLNPLQREIIWLRFFENLSVEEAAQKMGKTTAGIRALQYRALENLRDILPAAIYDTIGRP